MNKAELLRSLNITREKLDGWLAEGLPHRSTKRGPTFEAAAVRRWLLDRGFASDDATGQVVHSAVSAAEHFGVDERTIRNWLSEGCPGRARHYNVTAIANWLREKEDEQTLLSGNPSPALERYRMARARREELALQRDMGAHIPRDEVHTAMGNFADVLRRSVEILQRRFGPEAANIFERAVADALKMYHRTFQENHEEGPGEIQADPIETPEKGI